MKELQGESLKKYNTLYRETDSLYHAVAVKSGLSDAAFWILYTICEYGDGCLQRDICNAVYTSKQTVHSAIRRLEEEGYLFLEPGRGRDKHIRLTERGEKLIEEKIAPVIARENAVFEEMGERDREELLRLTDRYVRLLAKECAQLM